MSAMLQPPAGDVVRTTAVHPRLWQLLALIVLSALSLYALFDSSVTVDGVRYFWLDDDQMISMRYARNLASGEGLVWNPGERVEGYTNPLWTLIMAAVHLLPLGDPYTAVAVRAVNWALACAVIALSGRLLRLLAPTAGLALAAVVMSLALGMDLLYWSVNGFETTLLTSTFLFVLTRILEEAERGTARPSTYLLIGLLPLIRSDAYHVSLAAAVLALGTAREPRRALTLLPLALVLPACHLGWRYWYYGDWLPNTYYLKMADISGLFGRGAGYLRNFASHYAIALTFAVIGTLYAGDRRRWLLLASLGIAVAHVLLVGSDIFTRFRFLAHVVPVLVVLAAAAVADAAPRLGRAHVLLAASLFLSLFLENGIYSGHQLRALRSYNGLPENGVVTGVLINRFTSSDTRVAVITAGNTPYFSRRYAIDLLGKSDRHIARKPADSSGHVGHNKHDVDYSFSLQPDLIVTLNTSDIILRPDFCSPEDSDGLNCTLLRHPLFVRDFRPYPVPIPYLLNGTSVYVRRDSAEWPRRLYWQEPSIITGSPGVQTNARAY